MQKRWDREYSKMFNSRLQHLGVVETTVLNNAVMASMHLRNEVPFLGRSSHYAQEEAFFVACQLHELKIASHWCNGRAVATEPYGESNVAIYDMRDAWSVRMDAPFNVVVWHVTRSSLDSLADAHASPRIDRLVCSPAQGKEDAIVRHFADLMLPTIDNCTRGAELRTGHLLLALQEYLAVSYGGFVIRPRLMRGGLAPWQLKRVTDYMRANMSADITLEQLAAECRLSVNHFVRAFRVETGKTPHRWLMDERLRVATELLKGTELSVSMIAMQCGFSDQSHFTRYFSRQYGAGPASWRRNA